MQDNLKRGVIIHHGSLPLHIRQVFEDYTKNKLCRICFATSTLVQGINMPFDAVVIDRFEKSKPLSVMNLIGRAGRSKAENKLDVGLVVFRNNTAMSSLRTLFRNKVSINESSMLDNNVELDLNLTEFSRAIIEDDIFDEYNLPKAQVERLSTEKFQASLLSQLVELPVEFKFKEYNVPLF